MENKNKIGKKDDLDMQMKKMGIVLIGNLAVSCDFPL